MKKVEAFIKPHRLDSVSRALHHVEGLNGMSVTDARGFGRGRTMEHDPRDFHEIVRIEAFCSDGLAEAVVSAIEQAAHTGLEGDGKIYVSKVEEGVRISTGERGPETV